jgi:hypothetical protein
MFLGHRDDGANEFNSLKERLCTTSFGLMMILAIGCIFVRYRWFAILFLIFLNLPTEAQSINDKPQPRIETLWEKAAQSNLPPQDAWMSLIDSTQLSSDSAVLLVSDRQNNKSLFVGANASGPGRFVPLPTLANVPAQGLRLIRGIADQLWIAGSNNYREGIAGGRLWDAYLAKLDLEGNLVWEHNFAGQREKEIQDLAALSDGDVVVVGKAGDKTWLARVSADARIVWERTFGLGSVAAVATVGDNIVVAAFDTDGEAVWRFNSAGEPIDHQVVEKISGEQPHPIWFIKLFVGKSDDAVYAFSLWSETLHPRESLSAHPLKVIKLDSQSRVVWREELSQAVLQGLDAAKSEPGHPAAFCFPPVIGLLANVNPLVACPIMRVAMLISQIDSTTGELTQTTVHRPRPSSACERARSWPDTTIEGPDRTIWLFGAGRCTWLDQISLTQ